jgi:hypothetical protein
VIPRNVQHSRYILHRGTSLQILLIIRVDFLIFGSVTCVTHILSLNYWISRWSVCHTFCYWPAVSSPRGHGFDSRPSWLTFLWLYLILQGNSGCLKIGHGHFLPHSSELTSHAATRANNFVSKETNEPAVPRACIGSLGGERRISNAVLTTVTSQARVFACGS